MKTREKCLTEAIANNSELVILYKSKGKRPSRRRISNISFTNVRRRDGYISAFCHKANANRTFKISRILSINGKWFIIERLSILGQYLLLVLVDLIALSFLAGMIYLGCS